MTEKHYQVFKSDIVDNLTSADTDKPLSANQGRLLNNRVTQGTTVPSAAGTIGDVYVQTPTPEYPPSGYIAIETPADLVTFANRVNAGERSLNGCLVADLDMTGVSYSPIGNYKDTGTIYYGTFDGLGHTIRNLTTHNYNHAGIFGYVEGNIRNLTLADSTISAEFEAGGIAGLVNNGTVENCSVVNCTISATNYGVGGLLAYSSNNTISKCYAYNNTLSGTYNIGGILGCLWAVTLSDCAVYGGTHGEILYGGDRTPTAVNNCYTSSTSGMTSELFHTKGFWDGTGVSGTTYLSWDFTDTWEWDSAENLPKLIPTYVNLHTLMYAFDGDAWILQNTLLDDAPASESEHGVKSGGVYTALSGKQNTLTFDSTPTSGSTNPVTSDGVHIALGTKQDTLTFDSKPTEGSTNPVTSGGVYTELSGKQSKLTFDTTPTSGSSNPVTSDGVHTALSGKQNTLTFDTTPTSESTNPVTSGGVFTALVGKLNASKLTTGTDVPTSAGTIGDVYVKTPNVPSGSVTISTPAELVAFAERVNTGEQSLNGLLTADLDMSGVSYTPIGASGSYTGIFDGCGHTVSNLTLSSSASDVGLFGYVYGGTIKRVSCVGFTLTATKSGSRCGSLIGGAMDKTTVSNCYAYNCKCTSSGNANGGLIGSVNSSTVSNCYVYNCTLSGGSYIAGLSGNTGYATLSNCAIYGGSHGGTLVGYNWQDTITNCYTSSSSGMTSSLFHTKEFWDGTGVSGKTYLSWDFTDIWTWNSTSTLPNLKTIVIDTKTELYVYNGSAWVKIGSGE